MCEFKTKTEYSLSQKQFRTSWKQNIEQYENTKIQHTLQFTIHISTTKIENIYLQTLQVAVDKISPPPSHTRT